MTPSQWFFFSFCAAVIIALALYHARPRRLKRMGKVEKRLRQCPCIGGAGHIGRCLNFTSRAEGDCWLCASECRGEGRDRLEQRIAIEAHSLADQRRALG